MFRCCNRDLCESTRNSIRSTAQRHNFTHHLSARECTCHISRATLNIDLKTRLPPVRLLIQKTPFYLEQSEINESMCHREKPQHRQPEANADQLSSNDS